MGAATQRKTGVMLAPPSDVGETTSVATPLELYARLRAYYGPQSWWPGDAAEIMYTAVLVQHSTWSAAARALMQLRVAELMPPGALAAARPEAVQACVRSSGGFRRKARTLHDLAGVIVRQADGDVAAFLRQPPAALREQLRAVHGIGSETADAVCLFAARHPVFVLDAYTRRIVGRLGWTGDGAPDIRFRQAIMTGLPGRVSVYGELHALLVTHGRAHCRPVPRCDSCPLRVCCVYGQAGSAARAPVPRPARRDWNAEKRDD